MTDHPDPHTGEFGLVMPFVVCASNGGTLDDHAFTCGWECAALEAILRYEHPPTLGRYVHTDAVDQLDLIAMKEGYTMRRVPWADDPTWTWVTFTRDRTGPRRHR